MNSKDLYRGFGEVDDDILERSEAAGAGGKAAHGSIPLNRRLTAALAAAILALLLMGAGIMAVLYVDGIQDWFGFAWETRTGQPMNEGQLAVIDHLSQEIGVSRTIDGVTVTVHSAAVGDDCFFLLLKVGGLQFSSKHSCDFEDAAMEMEPNLIENGGLAGFGLEYLGLDGDGCALLLLDHSYGRYTGYQKDTQPLKVELTLRNVMRDGHTDRKKVLAEGEWFLSFEIDRSRPPEVILLPDTPVWGQIRETGEKAPITLTDIELTNTGLRFQYEDAEGTMSLFQREIEAVLKNGETIWAKSGVGVPINGFAAMSYSYHWFVPVDLDEVASVRVGGRQIPVQR